MKKMTLFQSLQSLDSGNTWCSHITSTCYATQWVIKGSIWRKVLFKTVPLSCCIPSLYQALDNASHFVCRILHREGFCGRRGRRWGVLSVILMWSKNFFLAQVSPITPSIHPVKSRHLSSKEVLWSSGMIFPLGFRQSKRLMRTHWERPGFRIPVGPPLFFSSFWPNGFWARQIVDVYCTARKVLEIIDIAPFCLESSAAPQAIYIWVLLTVWFSFQNWLNPALLRI